MCRVAIAFLALVASSGCLVVSLQPAYDAASVTFDEALVGSWENAADQTGAVIDRAEWRAYKITYTDRFATLTFHANLTALGSSTFLDVTQVRGSDAGPYLIPVHGILRVMIAGDTLSATPLDYGWFLRTTTSGSMRGLTTAVDDRRNIVVASPSSDVRRWLTHAPEAAFSAPMTFTRKK